MAAITDLQGSAMEQLPTERSTFFVGPVPLRPDPKTLIHRAVVCPSVPQEQRYAGSYMAGAQELHYGHRSDRGPLDFIERDLIAGTVIYQADHSRPILPPPLARIYS